MAAKNLFACLNFTLKYEGGFSNHPSDPGGATMKGVTLETYRRYRPGATVSDLKRISDADLGRIYRIGYWDAVRADDLPAGVDLAAFDVAVNSGPGRARQLLSATAGEPSPAARVRAICRRRLSFLQGLRTWSTFGRGWSARVAACEALGVRMALGAAATSGALENAALDARRRADGSKKVALATAAAPVVVAANTPAEAATGAPLWLFAAIGAAVIVTIAVLLVRRAQAREAAEAYEFEAARARALAQQEG